MIEKKISKNGDYYIDLLLKDSTGQINAKIWHFCDFYDLMFNEGDLVAVKGIVKNDLDLYPVILSNPFVTSKINNFISLFFILSFAFKMPILSMLFFGLSFRPAVSDNITGIFDKLISVH